MLKDFQVRVVANACITRVNDGEGLDVVVASYPMDQGDQTKVLAYVYILRPDLNKVTETV